MKTRFELFLYRLWLIWERSKLEVREKYVVESRENVEILEKLISNLEALNQPEREGE